MEYRDIAKITRLTTEYDVVNRVNHLLDVGWVLLGVGEIRDDDYSTTAYTLGLTSDLANTPAATDEAQE
jgi:hypothetical protein